MNLLEILLFNKLKNAKGGGITPTGTINITTNGEHDVTIYATANVNVTSDMNTKIINVVPGPGGNTYINSLIKELPEIELQNITSTSAEAFFQNCSNLKTIRLKNSENIKAIRSWFRSCTLLENIIGLNCSGLTTTNAFQNTFASCPSLTDDFLKTIPDFCVQATGYNGTKTLAYMGLTSAQATVCTQGNKWAEAQTAGWTTGY